MQAKTSTCDDRQRQLAASVGVDLPNSLPRIVAVARLQGAIAELFGLNQPKGSGSQLGFLAELAHEASEEAPSPASPAEAHAWIQYFCLTQRAEALRTRRLNRGDLVRRSLSASEIDEVASIGDDGAVYFTGGRARAWPDELTVVARAGDTSPSGENARRKAREPRDRTLSSLAMVDSQGGLSKLESTDRSLKGRAAGLAERSAGVAAFAGRCRGRTGARSRRSARLGGAEGAGARVREACAGMLARGLEPGRRCERASGGER